MADPVAKVEGLDRLVRTLGKAKVDLSDLKDANRAAGETVAGASRASSPRRSGHLAGSVRSARQVRRARVMAGKSSVPYAGPIHWGWPARGIAAQPFIAEAAQATEGQWAETYRKDVQRVLDQVQGA